MLFVPVRVFLWHDIVVIFLSFKRILELNHGFEVAPNNKLLKIVFTYPYNYSTERKKNNVWELLFNDILHISIQYYSFIVQVQIPLPPPHYLFLSPIIIY